MIMGKDGEDITGDFSNGLGPICIGILKELVLEDF